MATVDVTENGHTRLIALGRGYLLDEGDDRMKAWAEHHVRRDPDIGWVLGNFVEADNYNSNGHFFPQADLETYGVDTVAGKPLNMLHHERYIVGAFSAGKMVYPEGTATDAAGAALTAAEFAAGIEHPIMEALSGLWRRFFPDEANLVARAHKDGTLFYSMECHPQTVTCGALPGDGCGTTYPFKGIVHESYCGHLNASRVSKKRLDMAHFDAGAIIIPPVKPGWSQAQIRELAEKISEDEAGAERLYDAFQQGAPHLDSLAWEHMMGLVMLQAREFSQGERKDAAKKGHAMSDGSFPIKNAADLKNAIKLAGNAKDPAKAKAHIKARAKALGLEKLLPDSW